MTEKLNSMVNTNPKKYSERRFLMPVAFALVATIIMAVLVRIGYADMQTCGMDKCLTNFTDLLKLFDLYTNTLLLLASAYLASGGADRIIAMRGDK